MREEIETAPRDGSAIILEDDAKETFDVAHWSSEAGEWIAENGEPIRITPSSHWYPMPGDKYLPLKHDGSSRVSQAGSTNLRVPYVTGSIAAALVAVATIGAYFRTDVAAFVTRYDGQQEIGAQVIAEELQLPTQDSQTSDLLALPQLAEVESTHEPTRVKQAVEASQSREQEERLANLANELAKATRPINELDLPLRPEAAKTAQLREQAREKAATLVPETARQELTASTAQDLRSLEEERAGSAALASELATARREIEIDGALLNKAREDAMQFKQTAERITAELQQERERAEALASQLAKVRREVETAAAMSSQNDDEALQQKQTAEGAMADLQRLLQQEQTKTAALTQEVDAARQAMTANAEQHRALDEARARAAALASELAGTRREVETQAAQSQKAVDEAGQQKQTAEGAMADLQRLLQQEQTKTAALTQEVDAARQAMTANAEQHRALDEARARAAALASELAGTRREVETQAAQSQKAVDEALQQKQTAEGAMADLQRLLQQERARTEALARDLAHVQRTMDGRVAVGRSADSIVVHVTNAVKTAVTEPPKAAEVQGSAEAAELIARASTLLGQGDIGAARIVLERASETGSAKASFMLAETYDPAILIEWGTYGTRGEVTKARELYAKADAGGIQEAKNRMNALRQ